MRAWGIGVAAGVLALLMAGPSMSRAQVLDQIIASVDGHPITMRDVVAYAAASGNPLPSGPSDGRREQAIRDALRELIGQRVLDQEALKFADRIDDQAIDHYIRDIEQRNHVSEAQLKQQMAQAGITEEQFRKTAKLELEKTAMIDEELRQKIDIPEEKLRAYYDQHKDEFTVKNEKFRLAQILVALPATATPTDVASGGKRAEEVYKRAKGGEDFGELARRYSDDESRSRGGELGYFAPGEILDQIKGVVEKLKPGEVSEPIRTDHGFHIVKLEEHQAPGLKPFAEVRADIRDKLVGEEAQRSFRQWIEEELVKKHYVESYY